MKRLLHTAFAAALLVVATGNASEVKDDQEARAEVYSKRMTTKGLLHGGTLDRSSTSLRTMVTSSGGFAAATTCVFTIP